MSQMLTRARANPASCIRSGKPSVRRPTSTGNTAVITEATGATTPMRPMASPLYSAAMPNAPVMPATTPQLATSGAASAHRVIQASASIRTRPQACAPATTRKTLARRVAIPPAKSPPPQMAAALKLSPAAGHGSRVHASPRLHGSANHECLSARPLDRRGRLKRIESMKPYPELLFDCGLPYTGSTCTLVTIEAFRISHVNSKNNISPSIADL